MLGNLQLAQARYQRQRAINDLDFFQQQLEQTNKNIVDNWNSFTYSDAVYYEQQIRELVKRTHKCKKRVEFWTNRVIELEH